MPAPGGRGVPSPSGGVVVLSSPGATAAASLLAAQVKMMPGVTSAQFDLSRGSPLVRLI